MRRFIISVWVPFFVGLIGPANACAFDTDCSPGSHCLKSQGDIYGICAGGHFPGNSNDDQPIYAPLDLNGTYGNTCSFDIDCGINSRCAKSAGHLDGVCVGSQPR